MHKSYEKEEKYNIKEISSIFYKNKGILYHLLNNMNNLMNIIHLVFLVFRLVRKYAYSGFIKIYNEKC